MPTSLAIGMSTVEEMLHAYRTNTIVLPDGTLITKNEVDMPMVSGFKGISLNVVALPRETLYIFLDGVTIEIRAREGHAL